MNKITEIKPTVLILAAMLGGIFNEIISYFIQNQMQFAAIAIVVLGDSFAGMARALNESNFRVSKAFKGVYVLVAFMCLLAVTLVIEKAFPYASWLSEAVMLPIILFLIVSILKSLNKIGLIGSDLLTQILSKVERHKDVGSSNNLETDEDNV